MVKFFVVFLAIYALVQADDWIPKTDSETKAIHEECVALNQVSDESLAEMEQMKYEFKNRYYVECVMEKLGLFDRVLGFITNRWAEQFKGNQTAAEVTPALQACFDNNEQGSPSDVWAFRGHKCFMALQIGQEEKEHLTLAVYA